MNVAIILKDLQALADPKVKAGLKLFAINDEQALGIKMPLLRAFAKKLGKNQKLSLALLETKIHEARILAAFIAEPTKVTEQQMELWVNDFYSWDVCDQCCSEVFRKTKFAYKKAIEWTKREDEFVKRAGFVMMATLAVHDKKEPDQSFINFFMHLENGANDNRNFIKKAVNWALRQIGKRNLILNREAILLAKEIQKQAFTSAKWIAADALRELQNPKIVERLMKKKSK